LAFGKGTPMTISSRTPEGTPNYCTVCGHDLRLEPSIDTLDGPCPSCGHLLWFPAVEKKRPKRNPRPLSYEGFVMQVGKKRFGPLPLELQLQLLAAIRCLGLQKRLPKPQALACLVTDANGWAEAIQRLQLQCQAVLPSR
jgi:hypothetical protein